MQQHGNQNQQPNVVQSQQQHAQAMANMNMGSMGMSNMNYISYPAGGMHHGGGGIPPQMAGMMALPHGMMMGPASMAGMAGMQGNMMMMMPLHFQANMGASMGAGGHSQDMAGSDAGPVGGNKDNRNRLGAGRGHHHQNMMNLMHANHPRKYHHHNQQQQQRRYGGHGGYNTGADAGGHYHRWGHGKGHGGGGGDARGPAGKNVEDMRDEDILRASSPMFTRIIVDLLRDGDAGKAKAWAFFQRLCTLNKADVYQYSVMLNACNDSFAAEALIGRMEAAGVQPSEVTYQKLYKIYLRDARVEQADAILVKMRALMQADGASVLPADYTNRVLTDMLLEMVKEGNEAEERAWVLFNRLRSTSQVNVIHYNVMLNTCKSTSQAVQLIKQAVESGIQPSDRTCLKLAKMYIKEGSLPSHPNQLEAVVKGLKKTSLFAGGTGTAPASAQGGAATDAGAGDVSNGEVPPMKVESREFEPGVPFSAQDARDAGSEEQEVARMLEQLLITPASNSPRTAPPPNQDSQGGGGGRGRNRANKGGAAGRDKGGAGVGGLKEAGRGGADGELPA